MFLLNGLIQLPWWGYIVLCLALTHITIVGVTVYLHRYSAHRALDLHPAVCHFFRFWLWLTTGQSTKAWTAIHRKHHARCETEEDPHSPQIMGIKKVMWQGAELYRAEAKNQDTLDRFGSGTPDDFMEKFYSKNHTFGVTLMLIIDLILFGTMGLSIWAVQMMWIPLFAAGIINGVAHYWGYRNFQCEDASKNLIPWGIFIGGEELHNNHHAYVTSAKFSNKWYEFDLGWVYIRILETLGLATVKKVAPKVRMATAKSTCDQETLEAITTHRYEVLANYTLSLKGTCAEEFVHLKQRIPALSSVTETGIFRTLKQWLHLEPEAFSAPDREKLDTVMSSSKVLKTVYSMRQELTALWSRSNATREQLVKELEDWCHRAESSEIAPLREFSRKLRCYA